MLPRLAFRYFILIYHYFFPVKKHIFGWSLCYIHFWDYYLISCHLFFFNKKSPCNPLVQQSKTIKYLFVFFVFTTRFLYFQGLQDPETEIKQPPSDSTNSTALNPDNSSTFDSRKVDAPTLIDSEANANSTGCNFVMKRINPIIYNISLFA